MGFSRLELRLAALEALAALKMVKASGTPRGKPSNYDANSLRENLEDAIRKAQLLLENALIAGEPRTALACVRELCSSSSWLGFRAIWTSGTS